MSWRDEPVTVRVPATSANLGPGFDALGLALDMHDEVQASVTGGGLAIDVRGTGEDTAAAGERHLVVRAMRAAFSELGGQPPGIALRCRNEIPQGFGLGSSAAAVVAGILAARALAGEAGTVGLPDGAVLDLAASLEGHADNAAACLTGGLTIAWTTDDGVRSTRLAAAPGLTPVLFMTEKSLPTATARAMLPPVVTHADAARNSARAALLIAALTSDPGLLLAATEDFLHQGYRAAAMPAPARLVAGLRAAGVPAVVSGAGAAVLAFTGPGLTVDADTVVTAAAAAGSDADWTASVLGIDADGATVTPGQRG